MYCIGFTVSSIRLVIYVIGFTVSLVCYMSYVVLTLGQKFQLVQNSPVALCRLQESSEHWKF